MLKKILALSLAVLMLFSFSACGEVKNEGEKKNEEKKEETPIEQKEDEKKLVITDTFYPQYSNNGEYDKMMEKRDKWFDENLKNGTLFSAKLGGEKLDTKGMKTAEGKDGKGHRTVNATLEKDGIEFTLEAVLYTDYPTVDYVVWAKNTSGANSKVISEFNGIDSSISMKSNKGYTIDTTTGSLSKDTDFQLVTDTIAGGQTKSYTPNVRDGRGTSGGWPYFDVLGKGEGVLLAVGWSGTWQTDISSPTVGSISLKARQYNLNTVLLPNEKLRSPRIVLTFFDGEAEYGHNIFRKLIIEHYTPDDGTENRFVSPTCINFWGGTRESWYLTQMQNYFEHGIDVDRIWMDAGWNGNTLLAADKKSNSGDNVWTTQRGWWHINTHIFESGGFKKMAACAQKNNAELLLWIELETASSTHLAKASIGPDCYYNYNKGNNKAGATQLLRLSDDAVFDKTLTFLTKLMDDNGVESIRLDFNQQPMPSWLQNDQEEETSLGVGEGNRLGITENKYIVNLYRFWDEMYKRSPKFVLDNCASGGRRLDIEMTKRGIPLWRTDYDCTTYENSLEARQAQTQWLSYWIPLSASGVVHPSVDYGYRSHLSSSCCYGSSVTGDEQLGILKKIHDEFKLLKPYWYGSYYQLIKDVNFDATSWQAYELFRDDWQKGFAVVIRRYVAPLDMTKIKFKGLLADQIYKIHNIDDEKGTGDFIKTGKELMEKGINLGAKAGSIQVYMIEIVLDKQ